MTDRKIHILFSGKTNQSGEIQRRELLWLIDNIKENEGEKREKYEKKLVNWIKAHPFIEKQVMMQGVTYDNLIDKLINFMGKTEVFNTEKVIKKGLDKYLKGRLKSLNFGGLIR